MLLRACSTSPTGATTLWGSPGTPSNVATDKSATMGSNGGMSIGTARGLETSLYDAVKCFLEAQGFEVKGEVCGCDIVAVRQGEPPVLVVTELK